MRICDRWMQEGTTDRRGRSPPPQCTTLREDSICPYHSTLFTAEWSVRKTSILLALPLTQNHRRLRRQWCDERRMWAAEWNEVVFDEESRICLQKSVSDPIRVWRYRGEVDAEQLRYAPPHWSCTGYYSMGRYWISLSHSSSTHCQYFKQPALHLPGDGASCPSLPSGLGHSHISTGYCAIIRGTLCPKFLRQSPD
ncbi:transposable element Tcb1 transposase [Trichonephila clavipes]|nr:transposable element Tcb1 transposase [Trichonephila clavipes]